MNHEYNSRAGDSLSGRVPQISVVSGTSAGGGAYSPALADFVVMAPDASMFLTGPGVVNEVMGEDVTGAELGGPEVHARNGVSHLSARSDRTESRDKGHRSPWRRPTT